MRKINLSCVLFALIALSVAFEEFTDSRGQCWRCYPGRPCEHCPRSQNTLWPMGWSDMCFEPNCNIAENRRFLYPSRESDSYFRCVYRNSHWTNERTECRCGTLFNMRTQECIAPRNWTPYCVELITPIMMRSCESGRRIPIVGNEGEPRAEPPTSTQIIWSPPDPTNTDTGTTTAAPNGNNTTTTNSNCNCIPWFPCWCNPCWHMPCRSCNGCMMMG